MPLPWRVCFAFLPPPNSDDSGERALRGVPAFASTPSALPASMGPLCCELLGTPCRSGAVPNEFPRPRGSWAPEAEASGTASTLFEDLSLRDESDIMVSE